MDVSQAISPVDGRYADKTKALSPYFSEMALFKFRLMIEIEYLIFLSGIEELNEVPKFTEKDATELRKLYLTFGEDSFKEIKTIEKTTNHDVKAVEYFLKNKLAKLKLEQVSEMVHFGLTSQDVNNTANALLIKESLVLVIIPNLYELLDIMRKFANDYADIPMLSRTHGQPASPTTVGKEFAVFAKRLERQIEKLLMIQIFGKFTGATGNYHTHTIAYPDINWPAKMHSFFQVLKLDLNPVTTQIEPYDCLAEVFDGMKRVNTIFIDLCQDIWRYISDGYFKLKIKEGEVGSSTMPHKVNPIDFENAEGNLGIANALFNHLSMKLPVSRLQRDLSDSTVLRNVGVPFAHSLIAYASMIKGFSKLDINEESLSKDLVESPEVLAEAIQTIMRKNGIEKPYEKLKEFSRGKKLTMDDFRSFIDSLSLPEKEKQILHNLAPETYVGLAAKLARMA